MSDADWRVLDGVATAWFETTSLGEGAAFIAQVDGNEIAILPCVGP